MRVQAETTNLDLLEAYAIRRRKRRHGFTPAKVPELKLWVRAESLTALTNNAAVSAWKDESGGGRDLVQANASYRPTYKANVVGLPGVSFDGVDDVLATASNVLVTDKHVVMFVARPSQAGNQDWVGTGGTGSGDLLMQMSTNQTIRGHVWRGGSLTVNNGFTTVPTNEFSLLEQQVTAMQMFLRKQGGS